MIVFTGTIIIDGCVGVVKFLVFHVSGARDCLEAWQEHSKDNLNDGTGTGYLYYGEWKLGGWMMVVQVQVVKLVKLSVYEPFIVIKAIVSESGNHAAKIGNVKMMTNTNTHEFPSFDKEILLLFKLDDILYD